jgi:hypothetical protein
MRGWEVLIGLPVCVYVFCALLTQVQAGRVWVNVVSLPDSSYSLWEDNCSHYNRVWNLVGGSVEKSPWEHLSLKVPSALGVDSGWLPWFLCPASAESRNAASLRWTLMEHLHHVWQVSWNSFGPGPACHKLRLSNVMMLSITCCTGNGPASIINDIILLYIN